MIAQRQSVIAWRVVTREDPGYPWDCAAMHYDSVATPGTWLDATKRPELDLDGFVRELLAQALEMAGHDPWVAEAVGKAPGADLGKQLRKQVREAVIVEGGINDLLYGCHDDRLPKHATNAAGRGICWRRCHANNLERMGHLPLKRTIGVDGQRLSPPDRGSSAPVVWSPAFDLAAFPELRFGKWADGSSTLHPPPTVRRSGVDLSGVSIS
ncbi:MAG: hypothetical protein K0U16_07240 [Gammaproteobacteria bacterium]|nr:hypothetical protein [Gammaproteobacteria bacterium]